MENNHEEAEVVETTGKDSEVASAKKKVINMNARTVRVVAAVVVILLLAYFAKSCLIAATVNGMPVSRLAVINQLEKTSGKTALDNLITQKLILAAAKKQGITVSKEEIAVEMKKIEDQLAASGQGLTLDALLEQRGMERDDLVEQIVLQKDVEKLLGDKIAVTDAEVEKYIIDNKITLPKGEEEKSKVQIKEAIGQQKIGQEGQAFVESLRADAKINYFVKY